MICVYKEYEVKFKMVQEQWLQLKMKFLLGFLTWKLLFSGRLTFGGGDKNLKWEQSNGGKWSFQVGEMKKFLAIGGGTSLQ